MIKVLVLGATGSMGFHLTHELANRGFEVIAFARDKKKLSQLFDFLPNVHVFAGDALSPDDLFNAAQGVDIIYHSLNVPYHEWEQKLTVIIENVLEAAQKNGNKIAYVDNIYAYGMSPGHPIAESHPKRPNTRKGQIRYRLEQRLEDMNKQGTPTLIAHFPDFYGPHAGNTLLNTTLQPLAAGKTAIFVGNPKIKREYIYLPDAASSFVELSLDYNNYGQSWNIGGVGVISGEEILSIAEKVLHKKCRAFSVGSFAFFVAGLFSPFMKEVREMLYLTEKPVILDVSKFEAFIRPLAATPYEEGIRKTLEALVVR